MTNSRVRFVDEHLVPPVPQQTQEHQQHMHAQKDQDQTQTQAQQFVQSSFAHTTYTQMLNPIVGYGNSASQLHHHHHHHQVGSQSMYQHVPEHELLDCAFSDAHKSMMIDEDPIGLPTLSASHGAVGDAVHNAFRENSDGAGAGPRDEGDEALFKPGDDDTTTAMKANARVGAGGSARGGPEGGTLIRRRHTSSSCTSADMQQQQQQQPASDVGHILAERSGEGGSGSGCGSEGRESNDGASNDSLRMQKLKRTISAPPCGLVADERPTESGLAAKSKPKKQRPMSTILANRRSAARSRARRVQYVADLEATVQVLKDHVNQLTKDLENERMSNEMVRLEANSLRSQVDAVAYDSSAPMQLMYQNPSQPQQNMLESPAPPAPSNPAVATPAHQE